MSQDFAFVQGDMIRLVAFDLVLRIVVARMMDIAFVVHILGVHPDDAASAATSLRIPADVITALECLAHVTTANSESTRRRRTTAAPSPSHPSGPRTPHGHRPDRSPRLCRGV